MPSKKKKTTQISEEDKERELKLLYECDTALDEIAAVISNQIAKLKKERKKLMQIAEEEKTRNMLSKKKNKKEKTGITITELPDDAFQKSDDTVVRSTTATKSGNRRIMNLQFN